MLKNLFCFLIFVAFSFCQETIIYPNNTNWLSILTTPQSPGSILTFRAGTYTSSSRVYLQLNGALTNPVIIRGYPGERIVFFQSNPNGANGMEVDGSNFVLDNFVIQQGSEGLRLGPSNNVANAVIQNLEIYQTQSSALTCNFPSRDYFNITISGCYIHDTCYGVSPGTQTGECMYLGTVASCSGTCPNCVCTANTVFRSGLVEGNLCVNTTLAQSGFGSGIQLKPGSTNNIIQNNVLMDTLGPGILTYGWNFSNVQYPGDNYIDGNLIWNSNNEALQTGQGFVITNNIIIGTGQLDGIHIQPNENVPAGVVILYNTIFSSQGGVIRADGTSVGNGGFVIANNALFAQSSASCFLFSDPSSVINSQFTFKANGCYGPVGYTSFSDPTATFTLQAPNVELLNPTGLDFYPSPSSSLIGNASTLSQFSTSIDFNCNPRNNKLPTVGAYQYSTPTNPGWQIAANQFKAGCNGTSLFTTTEASTTGSSINNANVLSSVFAIWIVLTFFCLLCPLN